MDVFYYDLDFQIDPNDQSIIGQSQIHFRAVESIDRLQLDLYENLIIDSVLFSRGDSISISRECNAFFFALRADLEIGKDYIVSVYYHGKPIVAKNAPWDGGFTFSNDAEGNHWIGTSVQGMGASLFWACKDHLSDEPDSVTISVTIPEPLRYVGNGRFRGEESLEDGRYKFTWHVSYPINLYNVSLNIANYVEFGETYISPLTGDSLDLEYFVLPENLSKAKSHFHQVVPMMECFEKKLGAFPFWEDGYKLVETPYLGMEHQTAIAYGNQYKTGYMGRDYSRIGLDFDYIIIHETGHEWWGNNVSCADVADLWIHEGFCTYSEAIYVECLHGYETALKYINAKKSSIGNKNPMMGVYHVHEEGSGDMYSKGMLFLNSVRHIINDDELWWSMLKEMQESEFRLKTISAQNVLDFFEDRTGMEMDKIFEQYLMNASIPKLEYRYLGKKKKDQLFELRFVTDVEGFSMPVNVKANEEDHTWITVSNEWTLYSFKGKKAFQFSVNDDLTYITVEFVE